MSIRPADIPVPLTGLTGVGDTSRSMDRDARERTSYARQQRQGPAPETAEQEQAAEEHLIDECA